MTQRRMLFFILSFFLLFKTHSLMAKVLPLETFIKHGDYLEIQISPDGKHLAGRFRSDDAVALIFIDIEKRKIVGGARAMRGGDIHSVTWVSNKRVVYEIAEKRTGFDSKSSTGELFAINIDGSNSKHLYGYRASDEKTTSRISNKKNTYSSLEVLNVLENDKKNILIIEYPWEQDGNYWYNRRSRSAIISKLNISSGRKKKIEVIPYNDVTAIADDSGNVNFIRWQSKDGKPHAAYRKKNKDEWQELTTSFNLSEDMLPLSISKDSSKVYMSGRVGEAVLYTIFELNLATGQRKQLFDDIETSIDGLIYDVDTLKPVVGITYPDTVRYHYTDGDSDTAKTHKKLARAFKGQDVYFTSRTKDGKKILVRVESDINPGEYFLYDTETKRADLVWANKSWVDPRLMRSTKSIEITARDNLKIKGYLTLPEPNDNEKSPLVVLVHGGPHGIRDFWEYNDEVQLLANRGYAVLQVNFRGSGGYGEAFNDKGERQWEAL